MTGSTLSEEAVQLELTRNYRFNFTVNAMDGASYWFGMSFISLTIILPLYVSHFTDNPMLIGLIPFISTAGFLIPQLFIANYVERAPRKKFFPVNLGFFFVRMPLFLLPVSVFFLAGDDPFLALVSFYFLFSWHCIGGGLTVIGWQDMVAKIFPVNRRGRFMGITNFIGNGSGVLGALAVAFLLGQYPYPTGFVVAFTVAAVLIFISWLSLSLTREPAVYTQKPRVSQLTYLRSLPQVVRRDHNFRRYLLSQVVFSLSGMASGFLIVYALQTWDLPDATAGAYVIAMQVGQALANLLFGFLADRKGHKINLEACFAISTASLLIAILAPSPGWFFLVFFLRGVVLGGTFVSGLSIVYEFTDAENRATYIGLGSTLPGISGALAPLIGGMLVGVISYQGMFLLSTCIAATSWALLRFTVREPRIELNKQPEFQRA